MQSDAYLPRDRQPLLIHIPGPQAKLRTFSDLGKNFTLRRISLAKSSRFSFEKRKNKPFCHLLTLQVNNSFLFTNGNTYTNRGTWFQLHSALQFFYEGFLQDKAEVKVLVQAIREYGGEKVYLHSFLTSALDGCQWLARKMRPDTHRTTVWAFWIREKG